MSVSKLRPAASIARDLQRRFLPLYEQAWAACKAQVEAQALAEHEQALVMDMLRTLDGQAAHPGIRPPVVYGDAGAYRWKAVVYEGQPPYVDLQLSKLPALLARQIVCTLQQWAGQQSAVEGEPCTSS